MIRQTLSVAERAFSNHVILHLKSFSKIIDITQFVNKYHWSMQKIFDLYTNILWDNPEIFYVGKNIQYEESRFDANTVQYAKLFDIMYAIKRNDLQACQNRLVEEIRKALIYARNETKPEFIALRLHDYIVQECEYDTVAAEQNDISPLARTAYSVFVRHKAVCEGYTMAYRYLLNAVHIQSEEIISDAMNHCWNYVNLYGKWYHVDVTYDDPVFIQSGGLTGLLSKGNNMLASLTDKFSKKILGANSISHDHFLMSDSKARKTNHFDWNTRGLPAAIDTTFDNRNWS